MTNTLGEYLRARREQVDPADAGIPLTGRRRTPGLRREEVATLAGISADYYLRLEQGRDRNPSSQVLESLARVLGLDAPATDYLLGLVAPRAAARQRPRREVVPTGARLLLDSIGLPAYVEGRTFDVLATNPLATAIDPSVVVGNNRLRSMFLDPEAQALHPDWEHTTGAIVAGFRSAVGSHLDDPGVAALVGELSLASEAFRRLWARADVKPLSGVPVRLRHPEMGDLELRKEKLAINETDGQLFVVYHAEPGSETARSLALLGSLAVSGGPGAEAGAESSPR